jgi:hypothetical protein
MEFIRGDAERRLFQVVACSERTGDIRDAGRALSLHAFITVNMMCVLAIDDNGYPKPEYTIGFT